MKDRLTTTLNPLPPNNNTNGSARTKNTTTNTTNSRGKRLLYLLKTFEKLHRRNNNNNNNNNNDANDNGNIDLHTNTTIDNDITDDDAEGVQNNILAILQSLQNSCLQRGLLEGDGTRVNQIRKILSTTANGGGGGGTSTNSMNGSHDPMDNSNSAKGGGGGRKKRRKGGNAGNGIGGGRIPSSMFVWSNTNTSSPSDGCGGGGVSSYGEEGYVLSNISRIILSSSDGKRTIQSVYPPVILSAAARVLACICRHCRTNGSSGASMVEFEMILSAGSQYLAGLAKIMQSLMEQQQGHANERILEQEEITHEALRACCTCATELIALIGTRLNRSTASIQSIQNAAESILWNHSLSSSDNDDDDDNAIVNAAAALLAAIPLAGNADSVPPAKLWTKLVRSTAAAVSTTLTVFYPARSSSGRGGITTTVISTATTHDHTKKRLRTTDSSGDSCHMQWIDGVKSQITGQADRLQVFTTRLKGYTSLLQHLLQMDGYTNNNGPNGGGCDTVTICCLPITTLLSTVDLLLTFSSLAESRYLTTRSKLRNLSVEGGLLSPNGAVTVASSIRRNGHSLFQAVASLVKSSSSLQYSDQMVRSTVECLQSSSSIVLQSVIDPASSSSSSSGGSGKRSQRARKWLHSSIVLRAMAVRSFACAMQSIGSHVTGDVYGRGLTLVAGCLLEQITPIGNDDEGEDDGEEALSMNKEVTDEQWGTGDGRAHLVSTCVDALDICLTSSGGFLPLPSREMVESICLTCLNYLNGYRSNGLILFSYTDIKTSVLRLGLSCVCIPWSDGGASTLGGMLQQISSVLKFDRDETVAALASSAWCICNSKLTPRAPPLFLVTRVVGQGTARNDTAMIQSQIRSSSTVLSQSSLIVGMRSAVEKGKVKKAEIEKAIADSKNLASSEVQDIQKVEVSTNVILGRDGVGGGALLQIGNQKAATVEKLQIRKQNDSMISENKPKSMTAPMIDSKQNLEPLDSHSNAISSKDHHAPLSVLPDNDADEESDDEFPPIVDCDPDDEDMM